MTLTMGLREIKLRNLKELDLTMKRRGQNVVQSVVMVDISDPERKVTCGETVVLQDFVLEIITSGSQEWTRQVFSLKSKGSITDEPQS